MGNQLITELLNNDKQDLYSYPLIHNISIHHTLCKRKKHLINLYKIDDIGWYICNLKQSIHLRIKHI